MLTLKPLFLTDISDHFPVYIIKTSTEKLVENKHTLYKRVITDEVLNKHWKNILKPNERFKQALYESDWIEIDTCHNPSECNKLFLKNFFTIYENIFPRKKIKLKIKDI